MTSINIAFMLHMRNKHYEKIKQNIDKQVLDKQEQDKQDLDKQDQDKQDPDKDKDKDKGNLEKCKNI